MNVVYKVDVNEREVDLQFPNLKRMFKREIVESGMENPHLSLVKWLSLPREEGITYSIGIIKGGKS